MSPFDYISGNPDNLVGGDDASMTDIQGPFVDLKAFLNSASVIAPPLVTSLPTTPVEGDEIYLDATSGSSPLGVVHARYTGTLWQVIGCAPRANKGNGEQNANTADVWRALANSPVFTAPVKGTYGCQGEVAFTSVGFGASNFVRLVKIAVTAISDDYYINLSSQAATFPSLPVRFGLGSFAALNAGEQVGIQIRCNTAAHFTAPALTVTPWNFG